MISGIILVITIQPGVGNNPDIRTKERSQNVSTIDTLMDLIRNMFPPNLVEACISQHKTEMQKPENSTSGPKSFFKKIYNYIHFIRKKKKKRKKKRKEKKRKCATKITAT